MDVVKTYTRAEKLSRATLPNVDKTLFGEYLTESGHYAK